MSAGQRLMFVLQKYIFAPSPEYDIIDGNVALAGDINSGGNYDHLTYCFATFLCHLDGGI